MTPEDLQLAARKIMNKFYQFKYMFMIALNILSFTSMVFSLHRVRAGWDRWYRAWRRNLVRFGGWLTIRQWSSAFKKDPFPERLSKAKREIKDS